MIRVPHAFALALGQLGDRRVLAVLAKSMAVTLAIFVVAGGAGLLALHRWLVSLEVAFSAELSALAAMVLTVLAGWLGFRIVALAVLQFFADEVVLAVEARNYPAAAASARTLSFAQDARNALKGIARAILVNALALPVAVLLLATGIGTPILFWAVNGWLLGRELMDMAWLRHRASDADALPLSGLTRFALGGIVSALLLVPFANLLAPVLGAAAATHLVQSRKRQPGTDQP
ncbi:EI24 domain-containing protein [Tsuneonella sp. YG55]|uniref:EI24 domain-containing protein n=1 Tax=Tsuneonella litorea TaxID=2976475 RepID=A0A9X2VZW0_9SPHN|nr:EI24 domain-containing protein [Tsuneonella litorea]MCT2557924.1 EI24 domain-containing protein [Tsuneonella litorea]